MSDAPLVTVEKIVPALIEWNTLHMRYGFHVRPPLHTVHGEPLSVQRSPHHYCDLYERQSTMLQDVRLNGVPDGVAVDHTPWQHLDFEVMVPGEEEPRGHVTIFSLAKLIQDRGGLLPLKVQAVLNRLNNPGEPM